MTPTSRNEPYWKRQFNGGAILAGSKNYSLWVVFWGKPAGPLAALDGANLYHIDLTAADLHEANLVVADLNWAHFSGANLVAADLSEARLLFTEFIDTNLRGAKFSRANVGWTKFGGTDLHAADGLREVNHIGPSTVGIDTLVRSGFKIAAILL
jgi:uncharacterized protein YjbI with pentapeptide repeats